MSFLKCEPTLDIQSLPRAFAACIWLSMHCALQMPRPSCWLKYAMEWLLQGWDKTYCLQYITAHFDDIHFFGDKTFVVSSVNRAPFQYLNCSSQSITDARPNLLQGGNDYEIFESPATIGHSVNSPIDTMQQCRQLFMQPTK